MPSFARVNGFQDIERQWAGLLPRCATNTPFQAPQWQRLWWEKFGAGKELLLCAFQGEGGLCGVAPLVRAKGELSLAGDTDVYDYEDFIVPVGYEAPFYQALGDLLAKEAWTTLTVKSVPEESPTLERLPELARAQGCEAEVTKEDVVPGMALPGTWDEYVDSLEKQDRHELRRKLRRLESAGGYRYYCVDDASDLSKDMDDFFALMKASSPDKAGYLDAQHEEFFRAAAAEMRRLGYLRLSFMEMGGERVASAISFDYAGKRFLYNSGYKPEFGYYSVGLLLKALCIRDAIDARLTYFDFMRGPEPYKYHLGGRDRTLYRIVVKRQ